MAGRMDELCGRERSGDSTGVAVVVNRVCWVQDQYRRSHLGVLIQQHPGQPLVYKELSSNERLYDPLFSPGTVTTSTTTQSIHLSLQFVIGCALPTSHLQRREASLSRNAFSLFCLQLFYSYFLLTPCQTEYLARTRRVALLCITLPQNLASSMFLSPEKKRIII